MYYRYKSKKRTQKTWETVLLVVAIVAVVSTLVYFRSYLYFWKFTYNRLSQKVQAAEMVVDQAERGKALEKAGAACADYRAEHPFQSDAYFLSARVQYLLGELQSGGSLSNAVIADSDLSNDHFLQSIRYIRKGMSLDAKSRPDDLTCVILAKSCFFSNFSSRAEIGNILAMVRNPKSLPRLDDRRFYGLVQVLNGEPEAGVQFLIENGEIQKDEDGKMFLASAYALAKQYTNAIMEYRALVEGARSPEIIRRAQIGLGKVYFRQSLFKESLAQFEEILKNSPSDNESRIWSARCYISLGDKFSAKKRCQDVLGDDPKNRDALDLIKQL